MKNMLFLLLAVVFSALPLSDNTAATTTENTGFTCNWKTWFEGINRNGEYRKGERVYVKVMAKQPRDIKYIELYVDGKSAGKEMKTPYEWGNGKGNKYLHYLKCGKHMLRIKIVDRCGKIHYEECPIKVICNGGHDRCVWKSWFETIKENAHYPYGKKLYVRVGTQKPKDIKYMELYVDGKSAGQESSHPYEWGKGKGNKILHYLKCGKRHLKVKIVDRCGKTHYIECYIYIDCDGGHDRCVWKSWFETIKENAHYPYGKKLYVRVGTQKPKDIKYMELYVDGKSAGQESSHPYEWGKGKGNKILHYLKCGKRYLKVKIVDRCGKTHYIECYIYIDCDDRPVDPCRIRVTNPKLKLLNKETKTVRGKTFTYYNMSVYNYRYIPNVLFKAAPDLPACGNNSNSSRTWVDIYDGSGKRLYGFCAFGKSSDLTKLWFAVEKGKRPPRKVRVKLIDRRCNKVYWSNYINIPQR